MFTSVKVSTKFVYASVGASGVSSGHHHDGNKVIIDYIASNQKNGGVWSFGGSGREYTVNGAGTYSTSVSYHIANNHWNYSISKDSPGQGCFWYGTRNKHTWSDVLTTVPTVYDIGVRTFTCGSDYIYVAEPKLQFRLFLGNNRINLNSLADKKVYAVYRGNSLLVEPSGTAIKPTE